MVQWSVRQIISLSIIHTVQRNLAEKNRPRESLSLPPF